MFGGIETLVMEQNVRLNRWWKGNTSNRKLWAEAQTVLWIHVVAEVDHWAVREEDCHRFLADRHTIGVDFQALVRHVQFHPSTLHVTDVFLAPGFEFSVLVFARRTLLRFSILLS